MGRKWDSPDNIAFRPAFWACVFGSLKPGAHVVAFGGTRMHHRLMCALEDAGFELRDVLCWLYGSGFPKSHDVSKAIDRAAGAEREVVGPGTRHGGGTGQGSSYVFDAQVPPITAPATPEAKQWDGWGTALSPSWEPIVLARKPLSSTVAANVLEHGTGGLNIDGCRLATSETLGRFNHARQGGSSYVLQRRDGVVDNSKGLGRWPPNVALDEEAAAAVDRQSGERRNGGQNRNCPRTERVCYGTGLTWSGNTRYAGETGGASRFFYCPKASTAERNAGLGDEQNPHPTVKPVALMRWLVRLVTPPGETVLDPFCGSGSTGIAAVLEGRDFVGIEEAAEAVRIAKLRCHHVQANPTEVADVKPARTKQPELF
jgi:site-specific DNA-methyltransferase (adenine-specific)